MIYKVFYLQNIEGSGCMKKKKFRFIGIFLACFVAIYALMYLFMEDTSKNIKLGLDLQGGFEVLYEVSALDKKQEINAETLKSTVSSLRKRIDTLGVSEPSIQIEGEDRIRIQLAGVSDQKTAREMLSTQAKLSFRDLEGNILLDGSELKEGGAKVTFSETNTPWVSIVLKNSDVFKEATEKTLGSQLVIWLDYAEGDTYEEEILKENSKIISAPSVGQVLHTKEVVIQGTFSMEEAQKLTDFLNAGSLPVNLKEIYSNTVTAQFGENALEETIFASIFGVALIFLFMLFYYRFSGFIAVVTLSFYIFLILVVFNWMNAVLTLQGIAALLLGIGMAVDANIITAERIKEELKKGENILTAFKLGNKNSFSSILDANLTTLIAAGVLFAFGTSSVKGFAIMLITSVLVSFVTAVFGSRLLMGLWVKSGFLNNKPSWFGLRGGKKDEV